jgi:hypothetical protein
MQDESYTRNNGKWFKGVKNKEFKKLKQYMILKILGSTYK